MGSLQEYYHTKHWIQFSKSLLDDKDCECALCHRKRWKWQPRKKQWKRVLRFAVHHKTYEYLNDEQNHPESYLILCSACHELCHTLYRYENLGRMYKELADIVRKFGFIYKKEV